MQNANLKMQNGNQRGFTIFEIIVAIFVISVGILAAFSLNVQIISDTNNSISRLTASYLAQEGIEIVRNMRDSNWVSLQLPDLSDGNYEADYKSAELTIFDLNNPQFLKIGTDGFYSYDGLTQTNFTREISISNVPDSDYTITKVTVTVNWQEKNKPYSAQVQENLYPWLPVGN